jgi:hypothetical protein
MAKRRFIAPSRSELDTKVFAHPVFDGFSAFRPWFGAPDWPTLAQLNDAMPVAGKHFVVQDQALLDDARHYEARIAERGAIATRAENWHDLFNAMIWCRYPAIKQALNAQQCAHIATMGPSQRNRAQYALTQFDEAGAVVCVRDPALLALWNRHEWTALFHGHASSWQNGDIRVAAVIGHALLEHALVPDLFLVGKCAVVRGDTDDDACAANVASAIAQGRLLNDPQELRPLPLAGIPGWYPGQDAGFFAEAACFRPLREDRRYPPPL